MSHRFQLVLTDSEFDELDTAATKENTSITAVIRARIKLVKIINQMQATGAQLLIRDEYSTRELTILQ